MSESIVNKNIILYGYWRSSAAYRVRIGLNLKQLNYESKSVHLVRNGGEQHVVDQVLPRLMVGRRPNFFDVGAHHGAFTRLLSARRIPAANGNVLVHDALAHTETLLRGL